MHVQPIFLRAQRSWLINSHFTTRTLGFGSVTSSRRETQSHLEAVIYQPLEGSQSTNLAQLLAVELLAAIVSLRGLCYHSNSDGQTVPQAFESDVAVDPRHGFSSALAGYELGSAHQRLILTSRTGIHTLPVSIQLADHDIRRMTDDRTPNTRNITTQETHPSLLQRVVGLFRLPQCRVDVIDRGFKGCEFHHRVGDLAAPERVQTLVESSNAFLRGDLAPSFPQRARERRNGRLHPHFDRLKRTQGEIGEELGGSGRGEVDDRFVGIREHLVPVGVLEHLVESILPGALEGVADEGWRPAEEDTAEAFGSVDGAPGTEVGGVELGVDLAAAFDQVEGGDGFQGRLV